jgi:DNA polymerase-4
MRKIIHVDMDAFFASIEQRDNPDYRGRPLAVGYSGERGVVSAASYEARRWGVRSAMSSKMAISRCPNLIFVPGRYKVYFEVSRQIMDIFLDYTDLVEPLSLDEAYLDVTQNHKGMPSATIIAREIKQRIREETGLTASAGVSVNKFLAKVASDYNKPDGLTVITTTEAESFAAALRIEDFFGVGRVTAEIMHRYGIRTGADLREFGEENLTKLFGKAGHTYFENAWGRDNREVIPHRIRKSVGAENTFITDLANIEEIIGQLREIAERVWRRITREQFLGRTVTLKVKYSDFEQITRSRTQSAFVDDFELFWQTAHSLVLGVDISRKSVRLLGLSISNIDEIEPPSAWQLEIDFPIT